MNWMSARSSRAPCAPVDGEARPGEPRGALEVEDPERGAEVPVRSFGAKSNARGSPTRRTSRLSAASLPTGTLASGRFGTTSRKRSIAAFTSSSRASPCLMRSATPFISALSSERRPPSPCRAARSPHRLCAAGGAAPRLLDERSALGVERPGVDAFEARKGLDRREALAARRERGEHRVAVLDDVLQVQHDRAG